MYATFIIDLVSLLLLATAFVFLWKERARFYSARPLLPAMALLSAGRIADMLVEHPTIRFLHPFVLSPSDFELLFAVAGNLTDVLGIAFLVYGFLGIMRQQRAREQQIHDLESLLPVCANCKKYRTQEGQWMPIEKYLKDMGAPDVTHGICPECMTKLYGDLMPNASEKK
jgi:hypothetical protein